MGPVGSQILQCTNLVCSSLPVVSRFDQVAMATGPPTAPKLLISPCDDEAPCELPTWCSPPDGLLGDAGVEIWRLPASTAPEPIILGHRAWFHFGRRHTANTSRQPDVELHTRTASRKQAVVLRNWHGQVFIMDMKSSHGTFLGNRRLEANVAKEWKPGVRVFFADRNTETFELLPRRLPLPLAPPCATKSSDLHQPATCPAPAGSPGIRKFAGARRMMGAQLGVIGAPRPPPKETDPGCPKQTAEKVQTVSDVDAEPPLYPGDWQVRADGLTEIGWQPQAPSKPAPSSSGPEKTDSERKDAAQCASLPRPALALRLESNLRSQFGPEVSRNLNAWGPHYPCPDHGPGWQFSAYMRCSARFDALRPAIVLTAAAMQSPLSVRLCWLTNIPASELHLRLTVAPLEVAEPAHSGLWQLDLPLPAGSKSSASVSLLQVELPASFYVRICCREPQSHGGVPLGFEFGSSLRPISLHAGCWSLCRSSQEQVRCGPATLAHSVKIPAADETAAELHGGSSPVSLGTQSALSSTSCASHASTWIASSSEPEQGTSKFAACRSGKDISQKQEVPPSDRSQPTPQSGSQAKASRSEQTRKVPQSKPSKPSSKNKMVKPRSNRESISKYCKKIFAERSMRGRREHTSDKSEASSSSASGRSCSEEALMRLSPARLLRRMKEGIRTRRLMSADFKRGRLRAAYSEALGQLCEDERPAKRGRRIRR